MFEDYPVTNYGLNDWATAHYLRIFEEDLLNKDMTEEIIKNINTEIEDLETFETFLKLKVIFEYKNYLHDINSTSLKDSLNRFFKYVDSRDEYEKKIKRKILLYINDEPKNVFSSSSNVYVRDESFNIALKNSGGIKVWEVIIDITEKFMLINLFDELYQIFHKKNKSSLIALTKKVLSPITYSECIQQIEIATRIMKKFPDTFIEFKKELSDFLRSDSLDKLNSFEKIKLMQDVLGSRILGINGEILLKDKLTIEREHLNKHLLNEGLSHTISSEWYAKLETNFEDFIEKFYILTYEAQFSKYRTMQYKDENNRSILNFVSNMGGINHEKYGNTSFIFRFRDMTSENILNTMYLVKNYEGEFWEALENFSEKVTKNTGISTFLVKDLNSLEKLVDNKEYFFATTFLTQIIERLLRELFLKLMYGTSGIFKEAKFTLGNLLDFKAEPEDNKLLLVFTKEELETMDYYLINSEYGWNLRNRIAHYNIEKAEVSVQDFSCLLHLLIFIFVKIEYQGMVFDELKPHLN
ncbi:DUF4209 domain-containing protein [Alkalihalobacillus sp. FSL R5-0424]